MTREIMVIRKDNLFNDNYFYFQGFLSAEDAKKEGINFERLILSNYEFMEKDLAEKNHDYKQPSAYFIIANNKLKKVFLYQRSSDDKYYSEKRLQGKWSLGLGGHIERFDLNDSMGGPILFSMNRELEEEIENYNILSQPQFLGYINYDGDDVGKVHFGFLYVLSTFSDKIYPKDKEIKKGSMLKLDNIKKKFSSDKYIIEPWSKIALQPLEKLLET